MKRIIWSLLGYSLWMYCFAVEPYETDYQPSIDETWRWVEIEELSDFSYFRVDEDLDGNLWLLRRSGAVAKYDGMQLTRLDAPITSSAIDIYAADNGLVYLLTRKGFWVYRDEEWRNLLGPEISNADHYRMFPSKDGSIWVGVEGGFYQFNGESYDFFTSDPIWYQSMVVDNNDKIWVITNQTKEIWVLDTIPDKDGKLSKLLSFQFNGTIKNNLLSLDADGRVWVLNPDPYGRCYLFENYERRLGAHGLVGAFQNQLSFNMAVLSSGRTLFCVPRGLAELDGKSVRPFGNRNILPTTAPCLLPLSGERLFIGGTESKTFIIDLSMDRWARFSGLNFQCEDQDGNQFFLEHDGRLVVNISETGEWLAYDHSDGLPKRPNVAFCSSDGTVWVSGKHEGGAAFSYLNNGKWTRMVFPEVASIFSHLSAMELKDGSVVFGSGTPVFQLGDRSGGMVVCRRTDRGWEASVEAAPMSPRRPSSVAERAWGELWFGGDLLTQKKVGENCRPVKFDGLKGKRWIDDVETDVDDNLWLAVWGKGVFQFNGVEWRLHSENEGLASDEVISLLSTEHFGGLWVVSDQGLSSYDGQVWTNWTLPYGKSYHRENVFLKEGKDDSLWINHAYRSWLFESEYDRSNQVSFETHRYRRDSHAPETMIVEYETDLPEGSPMIASWTGVDRWSDTPVDQLQYSWRLGDGEWSGFSTETSTVLYGVSSGRYRFQVRCRDRDWNVDPTPAVVSIQIFPPVWKQSWFLITVFATFAFILFLLERLFRSRVRAALAMEEFKIDFFTNISHELRNPLAVIMAPIESVLQENPEANIRKRLQLALRSAQKMHGLVDQLLQFRKVELGKSVFHPEPGELLGFIRESISLHEPLWEQKQISLYVESNLSSHICAFDSDKLQKVIDNLLSNAIKYSNESGEIRIKSQIDDVDGKHTLSFVIEDQGQGIPQHEIDWVMKPFYRARGCHDVNNGFGIGLALVRGLVDTWGGTISIESQIHESGSGTRVSLLLPLERAHSSEVTTDQNQEVEKKNEPSNLAKLIKVLLVEDNLDLRHFMRDELSDRFDILEAGNGRDALDLAIQHNPDLIVTDVMMPEMDGFELCRQLRAETETSHVPVIMLTAKSVEDHSVAGIESGADVYFTKPLNMNRLLVQIDHLLEVRQKMKQRFAEQLVIEPKEITVIPADQELLSKAIRIVEENMSDVTFGVDQFAREMGLGRTALLKKLKAVTGEAPGSFIRSMRLKRAAQLLSSGELNVSDTLDYIGIDDPSYFSRAFKKEFGVTPSQYAKNNHAA